MTGVRLSLLVLALWATPTFAQTRLLPGTYDLPGGLTLTVPSPTPVPTPPPPPPPIPPPIGGVTKVYVENPVTSGAGPVDPATARVILTDDYRSTVTTRSSLADRVSGVVKITDGSSKTVIPAQGPGLGVCVTTVIVSNTAATGMVEVDLRDGITGAVLATIPAPALSGAIVPLPTPVCTSANSALAADPSGAGPITVTAIGFKARP